MGQACCVPRKKMSRRTAKLKAEARSAAASGQQQETGAPPASPSMADAHADLLHSGRLDELREMHAASNSPVRGLREPRSWLQQKKRRLTAQKTGKKSQLPETFTRAQDKHKGKNKGKNKVKVAGNEAPFADNNEPITLLEATLLEEIPLGEAEGPDRQAATPADSVRTLTLRASPEMAQRQGGPRPCAEGEAARELLSPIPRRPANALQFPFINQTSDASTCSSKRSSNASDEAQPACTEPAEQDRDAAVPSESSSTASAETVIARRTSRADCDNADARSDAGTVRYSISSVSPDIFYMAPASPQSRPAMPLPPLPTLTLTPASPPNPALQQQMQCMRPAAVVDPNRLDASVSTLFPGSRWARTASSPTALPGREKQLSSSSGGPPSVTWSDPSPFADKC